MLACGLAISNFFKAEPRFLRYEEMVHAKLDEYFTRVNAEFEGRHVKWCAVHGHFWVEIRLPAYRRLPQRELPTQLPTVDTQEGAPLSQRKASVVKKNTKLDESSVKKREDRRLDTEERPISNREEGELEDEISKFIREEEKDEFDRKDVAMRGANLVD